MTKIRLHLPDDIDKDEARELARLVSDAMPKGGDEVTTSSGARYRVAKVERVIRPGSPTPSRPIGSKN
jgi:hypothetical protein